MNKQEERHVLNLFDRYVEEALSGRKPSIHSYLEECPTDEVDRLRAAIEGINFVIENQHCASIAPSDVEATLAEIRIRKQRKRRFAEFHAQMLRYADAYADDAIQHMNEALHLTDTPAIVPTGVPMSSHIAVNTFHRNNTISAKNSEKIDALWLRMAEARIQMQVDEVLRKAEIKTAPVNLEAINKAYHLLVMDVFLEDADGCLVTDHEVGGILLSKSITHRGRRRFTWAHEIGHFNLHKNKGFFRSVIGKPYQSSTVDEVEAHIFASSLLMPTMLLPKDFGQKPPTLEQGDVLADQFDVSKSAAHRRIVRASHWSCAFVQSLSSEYQWHEASSDFDGFLHKRLHPSTAAAQLAASEEEEEMTITLPASVWMEGELARDGWQVREQSRRTVSGHIYTILTVIE